MTEAFALQARTPLPLDEIRAHLDALPLARRDRWDDAWYLVADTPELLQFALEERDADRTEFPRVVAIVEISASRIYFGLQTREVETARTFAR